VGRIVEQTRWLQGCGTGVDIRRDVMAWMSSGALHGLLAAFASNSADWRLIRALQREIGTIDDRLDALDHFSARWDMRSGGERYEAGEASLTELQVETLGATLTAVGMYDETGPLFSRYDHVLILGGMVDTCLMRADHAAELISSRLIRTESIMGLSAYRPLVQDEQAVAEVFGIEDQGSEYSILDSIIYRKFSLSTARFLLERIEDGTDRAAAIGTYLRPDGLRVMVVAAPSGAPGIRRANTGDTYSFIAERLLDLSARPRPRLLIVSSPLNRLAQHSDALRLLALPHGMRVDTIGCKERIRPGSGFGFNAASECLMELRAAIHAMRRLASSLLPRLLADVGCMILTKRREDYVANDFEAPQGVLETLVAEVAANVLQIDRVGRADSFYDFAGTSMQAVLISARIEQETGKRVGYLWLFETDMLADFAKRIETSLG
jgi:hypothetical protein